MPPRLSANCSLLKRSCQIGISFWSERTLAIRSVLHSGTTSLMHATSYGW